MMVDMDKLEIATKIILEHIRTLNGQELEIDEDYYWWIPSELRYNFHAEPSEHAVGQLSDDWENIRRIAAGQDRPVSLALSWLGALFVAVGERSRG
jgi:hypothetical protein